jgi:hypothetical protein
LVKTGARLRTHSAQGDGFAPTLIGPLIGDLGAKLEEIDIVLNHGFTAKLTITDDTGIPITNALVRGKYDFKCWSPLPVLRSESLGDIVVSDALTRSLELTVRARAYQHGRQTLKLAANQPETWKLRRAEPARITLKSKTGWGTPGRSESTRQGGLLPHRRH